MSALSARDTIEAALRGAAGWGDSRRVDDLLTGYRDEILAEVTAWLTKKALEFRAHGDSEQADVASLLASKVARGAVRPDNLRMPCSREEAIAAFMKSLGYDTDQAGGEGR